jgi:hypothetical protein
MLAAAVEPWPRYFETAFIDAPSRIARVAKLWRML